MQYHHGNNCNSSELPAILNYDITLVMRVIREVVRGLFVLVATCNSQTESCSAGIEEGANNYWIVKSGSSLVSVLLLARKLT